MSEYLALNVGMDYDEFVSKGKEKLHEHHYDALWHEARSLTIGASVVFAMFDAEGEPILIRIGADGKVRWEDQYVAIGTGGAVANVVLSALDYDEAAKDFLPCLYEVMRAKVASETDIYVGTTTTIEVLLKDARRFDVSDALFKYIKGKVRQYKTPKLTFLGERLTTIK